MSGNKDWIFQKLSMCAEHMQLSSSVLVSDTFLCLLLKASAVESEEQLIMDQVCK
jgi:predicted transcriptional regulator